MERSYRTFLTIWFGQLVSTLGSGLTNFGVGVWIYEKTHSATMFSMAALFTALPGVLLSPIAGSLVDRWDRRVAMMVSAAGSGLASLALALLVLAGNVQLWQIFLLMAVSSSFATLTFPAISAITALLVPDRHLGRANGLLQFNEASSMILTPLLAVGAMARGGLPTLVLIDVASFAIAIGCLVIARAPSLRATEGSKQLPLLEGAMEGWRFIVERPGLVGLLLFFLTINFTLGLVGVLFTPLVLSTFDRQALGTVMTAEGVGMLVGTIALGIWGGPKRRVYGVLGFGAAATFLFMLVGLPPSVPLYVGALSMSMALFPVVNASSQAIWQRKVPKEMQGRVFSIRRMIAWVMTPLAFGLAGTLADRVFEPALKPGGALSAALGPFFGTANGSGIRVMFVLFGLISTLAALLWLLHPRVRNVEREIPDAIQDAAPQENGGNSVVAAIEALEPTHLEP